MRISRYALLRYIQNQYLEMQWSFTPKIHIWAHEKEAVAGRGSSKDTFVGLPDVVIPFAVAIISTEHHYSQMTDG